MGSRKRGSERGAGQPVDSRADEFFPSTWLVASYFLIPLAFFLPALLPGKMIFGVDYLASAYFFENFASSRFLEGSLPKWLPVAAVKY